MRTLRRCCLCGKLGRTSKMNSYIKADIYSDTPVFYHQLCLEYILEEPENHTNQQVDLAIVITDYHKERLYNKRRAIDKRRFKDEQIKYLHKGEFSLWREHKQLVTKK